METKLSTSQAMHKLGIFNDYYKGKLTEDDLKSMRRDDLMKNHPDKGGDADKFAEINACWSRVMEYLKEKKIRDANKCEVCDGKGLVEKNNSGFISMLKCPKCKGKGVKNV